jgi:hypothetical protein
VPNERSFNYHPVIFSENCSEPIVPIRKQSTVTNSTRCFSPRWAAISGVVLFAVTSLHPASLGVVTALAGHSSRTDRQRGARLGEMTISYPGTQFKYRALDRNEAMLAERFGGQGGWMRSADLDWPPKPAKCEISIFVSNPTTRSFWMKRIGSSIVILNLIAICHFFITNRRTPGFCID